VVALEGSLVRHGLGGGYYLTYCQEHSLLIFIILAIVSMGAAILWAVKRAEKKLRCYMDRCPAEPDADEEKVQQRLFRETTLTFP